MGWHLWTKDHDPLRNDYYVHWFAELSLLRNQTSILTRLDIGTVLQASSFSVGQMIAGRVITVCHRDNN